MRQSWSSYDCHKLAIDILDEAELTTMEFVQRMLVKDSTIIFSTNDCYLDIITRVNESLDTEVDGAYNLFAGLSLDVSRWRLKH